MTSFRSRPVLKTERNVPTATNLPFSSPITTEIPFPRSPDDDFSDHTSTFSNPFASSRLQPGNGNESDSTSGMDEFALDKYRDIGSQQAIRRISSRRHARNFSIQKSPGQKKAARGKPGLNLVTNFSRRPVQVQDAGIGFVGLSDLKNLSTDVDPSSLERPKIYTAQTVDTLEPVQGGSLLDSIARPQAKRSRTAPKPSKRLYNELTDEEHARSKRTINALGINTNISPPPYAPREVSQGGLNERKITELSPSDRPIPIGLSVSSANLAQHAISPESTVADPQSSRSRSYSQTTPATPVIIITPATDTAPWPRNGKNSAISSRRPASSIYSQSTAFPRNDESEVPPLPDLWANARYRNMHDQPNFDEKRGSVFDTADDGNMRQRRFSTSSIVEDHQPTGLGRRFSNESQRGILSNRLSVNTVATRHRSHGWWNYIVSPFITRSSTFRSKRGTPEETDVPPLPNTYRQEGSPQEKSVVDEKEEWEKWSSTGTSDPKHSTCHSSIWTDMSAWERERDRFAADAHSPRVSMLAKKAVHMQQGSSATIPFMMAGDGLAAEYFRACAHDQNSPWPYFECQNHSCALEGKGKRGIDEPRMEHRKSLEGTAEGEDKARDIDERETESFNLKSEEEENRGTAALVAKDGLGDEDQVNHNPHNPFFQSPQNRFSAAFREIINPPRPRSESGSTIIDDEPDIVSPNVHEASAAPVRRAGPPIATPIPPPNVNTPFAALPPDAQAERSLTPESQVGPSRSHEPEWIAMPEPHASLERGRPGLPPYSPPRRITRFPPYVAVMPPDHHPGYPDSPGPLSPGMQQALASRSAIPMSEMSQQPAYPEPSYQMSRAYHEAQELPPRPNNAFFSENIEPLDEQRRRNEVRRQGYEREDAAARKVGGLWRGRGCFGDRGCIGRGGREGRNKRRWFMVIGASLLVMVIVVISLAMTITRRGDATPVQSAWVNITGFPPMPTGISTIARPDAAIENSGCVKPSTMWSCAVPKAQQSSIAPNDSDQPNFRLEIRFVNGTINNSNSSIHTNSTVKRKLSSRDAFLESLYTADPAPPSTSEQVFLGNTTDNITGPNFAGEATPFFISLLNPANISNLSSAVLSTSTSQQQPTALPLPFSQPLRLYNRGESTEHFGFYSYFTKSILLSSQAPIKASQFASEIDNPPSEDEDGGSTAAQAKVMCFWRQTRFLVQIWTGLSSSAALLGNGSAVGFPSTATRPSSSATPTADSSNVFTPPGSFPYPVTISVDRHGGDPAKKEVACYPLTAAGALDSNGEKLEVEDRGNGGNLVNPAVDGKNTVGASWAGGVDGGTGGCECQWQNWETLN